MGNTNWAEVAARILDYCQTRDAFLRATEITAELVQIWAEELAKANQPEGTIREAAANAYRNAAGKPPADPLGAILTEISAIKSAEASLDWRKNQEIEQPPGQVIAGPIHSTYLVHNAIDYRCEDNRKINGGIQKGCGAPTGKYCLVGDGSARRTPHHARLHIGLRHLDRDKQLEQMYRQSPTFNPDINVHTNRR